MEYLDWVKDELQVLLKQKKKRKNRPTRVVNRCEACNVVRKSLWHHNKTQRHLNNVEKLKDTSSNIEEKENEMGNQLKKISDIDVKCSVRSKCCTSVNNNTEEKDSRDNIQNEKKSIEEEVVEKLPPSYSGSDRSDSEIRPEGERPTVRFEIDDQ